MSSKPQANVTIQMSDNGEETPQEVATSNVLPKEILENAGTIKLFNRWDYSGQ